MKYNISKFIYLIIYLFYISEGRSNPTLRVQLSQEIKDLADFVDDSTDEMKKSIKRTEEIFEGLKKISEELKQKKEEKNDDEY